MPADYSIYVLGESQITISGSGQLDGVNQGDGSHLNGLTITLNTNAWVPIEISDNDPNFQDNDGNQTLFGAQDVDGVTYAGGTRVEAEYGITLTDGTNTWQLVGFNVTNSSPAFGTVEGLAFIGGPGGFPPIGVPLLVNGTFEGPNFAVTSYATPICVVAGTDVLTPHGARRVEDLAVGDEVVTRDHGVQVVRWTSARTFPAQAHCAPVRFGTGALGNTSPLYVSQQHRVLIEGWQAELLFGEHSVLVPAVHLINDTNIRMCVGGTVRYHHLLLDNHAVIKTNGAWTETLHVGPQTLDTSPDETSAELLSFFPELEQENAKSPLQCGYPVIKKREAALLAM